MSSSKALAARACSVTNSVKVSTYQRIRCETSVTQTSAITQAAHAWLRSAEKAGRNDIVAMDGDRMAMGHDS